MALLYGRAGRFYSQKRRFPLSGPGSVPADAKRLAAGERLVPHMTDRAWVPGAMPDSPGDGTGGRGFDGSMDTPWQSPAYAPGLRI